MKAGQEEVLGLHLQGCLVFFHTVQSQYWRYSFPFQDALDGCIAFIEYTMWTESITLKKETFMSEIADLKRTVPKV